MRLLADYFAVASRPCGLIVRTSLLGLNLFDFDLFNF